MIRVLVTGSRTWGDWRTLNAALDAVLADARSRGQRLVVIHGACTSGADQWADQWALSRGVSVDRWPAEWSRLGKRAGMVRNAEMVAWAARSGAELCLAFIRGESAGATHCAGLAEQAGIPTKRWMA